jgi:DUF4097 and DUF4098 domain-containing protein YvlB
MNRRLAAAVTALVLLPLAGCGGGSTTTDEVAYTIDQPFTALVIDSRAAAVEITTGDGPASVKEVHKYSKDKPRTGHQVDGQTLRLTESGCVDDNARCGVEYHITVPAATTAQITAQAGAVRLTGLAGDIHVTTQAGAVEGTGLSGAEVVVKSQAGAVSLEFTEAPTLLRANTELGAVELRVPGDSAYAVAASTDLGKAEISVRQDAASAHRIEASAQAGAVTVEPRS